MAFIYESIASVEKISYAPFNQITLWKQVFCDCLRVYIFKQNFAKSFKARSVLAFVLQLFLFTKYPAAQV
jgi:hypothetical protein